MKREMILLLLAALCLTGCSREENPYRVDTVIQIPVDPTEDPTAPPADTESTEPETEPAEETPAPTEKVPSTKKSTGITSGKSTGKSSGTGKTSSGKSSKKETASDNTKETKPAQEQTEPVETTPPVTEPPTTQPPATEPPETAPPETAPSELSYDPSGYSVGNLEYGVLERINAYRTEAGVPPLAMDENLCAVASVRAYETSILWSHSRPDGRGYASVLTDYGYAASGAAEHLVYVSGSGDAAKIVSKWMSAEKNQESLLRGDCPAAGIGVYRNGGVTYLACLLIG